jgi:4-aminobutyrate aminotransferase
MDAINEKFQTLFKHLSPVWSHYTDIIVSKDEGTILYDLNGKPFLDFTCGIGVTNTGHCHPKVVKAIQEQAQLLLHGQANIITHLPMLNLVEALLEIVPKPIDGFFFSNSGAEAVEGAVKLARHATGKSNIIVFQGSFHGRTANTMAMTTSKTIYRSGYQPLPAGVFVAPYPYALRFGWNEETTSQFCLEELEFLLQTQTAPSETAAMIVEPVLGEGGYVVPPASFLKGVRELCSRHNILLIVDEIQSGFGRTGRWFALEHFDMQPDIMVVAKGLASGLPLSGVFSSLDLMSKWVTGSHGGTYGGNAVACAAATATISAIKEEGMLINAQRRGEQLVNGLKKIQQQYPAITEIRGLGLMIGCEFRNSQKKPDKSTAKAVAHACLDRGLILLTCGPWDNTIRWIPPLNVTGEQVEQALEIFEQAMKEVVGG